MVTRPQPESEFFCRDFGFALHTSLLFTLSPSCTFSTGEFAASVHQGVMTHVQLTPGRKSCALSGGFCGEIAMIHQCWPSKHVVFVFLFSRPISRMILQPYRLSGARLSLPDLSSCGTTISSTGHDGEQTPSLMQLLVSTS